MRAVLQHHGHRRMHSRQGADGRLVVKILVPVPVAGRDRPRRAIHGDVEFGQFLRDVIDRLVDMVGKLCPETDTVIEHAQADCDGARCCIFLAEGHGQFVVYVVDPLPLAPGLFPGRGIRLLAKGDDFEVAPHRVGIGEVETDSRFGDDRHAIARHLVIGDAFTIRIEGHRNPAIG